MYHVDLRESGHEFEKKNLVTIIGRKGGYDLKVCKFCGIKGKQYSFESIEIGENYSRERAFLCPKAPKREKPKQIRITYCTAQGKIFENITPDSVHDVVPIPEGEKDDNKGVWVMGVGEPIKVLNSEFKEV